MEQKKATDRSKALIAFFWAACVYVALATDLSFGWWWLVVVPVGMIVVSAAGGVLYVLERQLELRQVLLFPTLLGLAQIIIATLGSYFALRVVHGWIT